MNAMVKRMRWSAAGMALILVLSGCTFLPWLSNDTAIAQTSGLSYSIVDTGQAETYDNFSALAV